MTNDVEVIKQRLDVADVVRDYLTLKQSGTHLKANCPFHHEKSASFMVNRERQIWHCFGCNEGGDIFTFVQRIENIDFREALRLLAEKAGVELTSSQKTEINRNEKTRFLDIVQMAASIYHRILRELPGAAGARDYLTRRGVSPEMIEQFQVGFSPTAWDLLTQYLLKKNFAINDLAQAGVTIVKTDGARTKQFDRFRGRIMFPIWDTHGRPIGFTGRILIETKDSGGKYVNTPETPLFHKGNVVYALHLAKAAIKEKEFAVLVEGQMDVIACHQSGMKNVVACSGTALTVEQLRLLKRYTDELRFAFDADEAGQHAAERSISLALAEGLVVKIISIPEGGGKDADECIKKDPAVWEAAVKNARPFIEHMMERAVPENQRTEIFKDARKKSEISQKIVSFIALLPSAIERDHWIQQAAMNLQTSPDALTELVRKARANPAPEKTTHTIDKGLTYVVDPKNRQMRSMLEERVMALLQEEFKLFGEASTQLDESFFSEPAYAALYKVWESGYTAASAPKTHGPTNFISTEAPVKDPTLELLLSAVYSELGSKERQAELRSLIKRLRDIYLTEQRELLIREIQLAERAGNKTRMSELLVRYQKLIS
ncbi:MAG: DNA primase [Candidatus Magasanikbacteria bacterium]|nr:DNA primase [Candidatus Magasanikbacteria bacterium]